MYIYTRTRNSANKRALISPRASLRHKELQFNTSPRCNRTADHIVNERIFLYGKHQITVNGLYIIQTEHFESQNKMYTEWMHGENSRVELGSSSDTRGNDRQIKRRQT